MPEPEQITIIVHSASGLKGKLGGGRKFFVVFGLGETKYQTAVVIDQSGNPVWKEEETVTVNNSKEDIFLIVREKDNVLGQVLVPVSSVQGPKDRIQKQALQPHKKCRKPQGELTYQCFVSKHRDENDAENETTETKKKPYRLDLPGEGLEKIEEGDTASDLSDVEQIDLDDLLKNSQANKNADEPNSSPTSNQNDKTVEDKENSFDNELDIELANAKDTLSKADTTQSQNGSIRIKPKRSKKTSKKKVKIVAHDESATSDQKESVAPDKSEKHSEADKADKKKGFSLKFLRRKKLLDQTKEALGKENNSEVQTADNVEVETLPNDSSYLDKKGIHSDKNDAGSVSSENSQPGGGEIIENLADVKIFYTGAVYDAEEDSQDDDIGDFNLENNDDIDGMQGVHDYQQTDDHNFSSGINIIDSSKVEVDGNKDKSKRKSSLKFLIGGSGQDKDEKQPEITKCTPNRGPVDEPTRLCIEGFNLGTCTSDITSLKVAGCDCLDTIEYESPQKIYCKTHFQFESHTGPIEIITKTGGIGILPDAFTFFDELEVYTKKNPKATNTFQAPVTVEPQPGPSGIKSAKTTDDVSSIPHRPKFRKLSRSASETELHARYQPTSFLEDQTDAFGTQHSRRHSEKGLRPRRKAPGIPDDDAPKNIIRRRASESAVRLMSKGLISSVLKEPDNSVTRRISSGSVDYSVIAVGKKKAPAPPGNQVLNRDRMRRSSSVTETLRPMSLPAVMEQEDFEKNEELLKKITKLEEDKAALQKDVTRMRNYIDALVSKVMERCPTALLQENHLKANLFL